MAASRARAAALAACSSARSCDASARAAASSAGLHREFVVDAGTTTTSGMSARAHALRCGRRAGGEGGAPIA